MVALPRSSAVLSRWRIADTDVFGISAVSGLRACRGVFCSGGKFAFHKTAVVAPHRKRQLSRQQPQRVTSAVKRGLNADSVGTGGYREVRRVQAKRRASAIATTF